MGPRRRLFIDQLGFESFIQLIQLCEQKMRIKLVAIRFCWFYQRCP